MILSGRKYWQRKQCPKTYDNFGNDSRRKGQAAFWLRTSQTDRDKNLGMPSLAAYHDVGRLFDVRFRESIIFIRECLTMSAVPIPTLNQIITVYEEPVSFVAQGSFPWCLLRLVQKHSSTIEWK